jgi:hypothetical protein
MVWPKLTAGKTTVQAIVAGHLSETMPCFKPVCHREARFAPWRSSWIASSRRDTASVNELTLFVIAKEPWHCGNPREQSISWIATSLRFSRDNRENVHCPITQRLGVGPRSRNDRFYNPNSVGNH